MQKKILLTIVYLCTTVICICAITFESSLRKTVNIYTDSKCSVIEKKADSQSGTIAFNLISDFDCNVKLRFW